jgi:hypothetical protein
MRVGRFSYEQNWLMALGGAIMTGHLIVWIMDLSIYLILMHFMGAILSIWIYKFITKDFVPQDGKLDITDVQNSRDSADKEDD